MTVDQSIPQPNDHSTREAAVPQRHASRLDPHLPLVSIITPTYNRAPLLPATIESILSQDYPNLEYVVLDDGSTDDTQAVLARYGDALRWEYHPNMGQPRTVNRGLELVRGEIIGFVSSDDPLLPGAISSLVNVLQDHPDVLVVYPDWRIIDEQSRPVSQIETFEYSYVNMVRYHHTYPGPCALFRRSVVDRIGGYDPTFRYVPDYDFWLRAGLLGPFRRVPRTLATYRDHAGAITTGERGVAMAREHIRVIEKLYERDDLPPEILAVKLEAYRNAFYLAGIVCRTNVPPNERFSFWDQLFSSPYGPANAPSQPEEPPAPPSPRRNPAAVVYDRISASRFGRIKHAVPLEWRVSTRRWLSKVGR
jgi:glycosyltransferase involved in cell wall biosynthesis